MPVVFQIMAREHCEYCGQLSRVSDPTFCWKCGKRFAKGGVRGAADDPQRLEDNDHSFSSSRSTGKNSACSDSDQYKSPNHEFQIPEYNDIYKPPKLELRIPGKKYGKKLLQENWNFQYRLHMRNIEIVKKWLMDRKIEPGASNTSFVVSPGLKKKVLKIIHHRYKRLTRLEFDGHRIKYWQPEDIYRTVHSWLKTQRKNKKGKVSQVSEEGSSRPTSEGGSHSCEVRNVPEGGGIGYPAEDVEEAECSNRRNKRKKKQTREENDDENGGDEEESTVFDEILVQGEMNAETLTDMYQRLSRHMLSLVDAEGDPVFSRTSMQKQSASQKLKMFATWLRNRRKRIGKK